MDLKNADIDGKILDVISEKEYISKYDTYNNPMISPTVAIEVNNPYSGKSFILPLRGKTDDRPGIYPDGSIYFVKEGEDYSSDNVNAVDFSDVKSVQDFINKNEQIRQMETNILTDIDSVFAPAVAQDDSPEMKAFKEAICSKHIDINKYAPRFGENFLNDKRILRSKSITLNKLVSMCEHLDMEAELTLRDARDDVANPMGREISVILTKEGCGE